MSYLFLFSGRTNVGVARAADEVGLGVVATREAAVVDAILAAEADVVTREVGATVGAGIRAVAVGGAIRGVGARVAAEVGRAVAAGAGAGAEAGRRVDRESNQANVSMTWRDAAVVTVKSDGRV